MNSIWNLTSEAPYFESLNGNIKTDVLIIGGGITGILCGYMLKESGIDCIIAEADRILKGVTQNTTAKITSQHGLIYHKIAQKYENEKAKLYYEAQNNALRKYRELCGKIPCDLEECDSYVYTLHNLKKLEDELNTLQKIGCNADFCKNTELPFDVQGAIRFEGQAHFNPLKLLYALSKDLKIYENTRITHIEPNRATAETGTIEANKIIVATHFPFINKHGWYFVKMHQHRSYVIALKNATPPKGMYVDEAMCGLSFRSYNGLLLLGGGSHRTGKDGGGWQELEDFAKKYYPSSREVCRWATQDCMTLDGIPYIGRYFGGTSDLYVATGFNKWGMSSAMVSAMVLADMIQERNNPYTELFNPSRSIFHMQLVSNLAHSALGLLTPTVPRCPHLGCALKYNHHEHTWDCPCHGSRFTKDGRVIDNPANGNKKL